MVCTVLSYAQDTIKASGFTVYAERVRPYIIASRTTTIDSSYLSYSRGATLSEILAIHSPLYVKDYGNGMISSLSFRGTAATHTSVLWNGFPIIHQGLGQSDFSILPVSATSDLRLYHGGASALFGSGAIGGTVSLSSAPVFAKRTLIRAQQDVGSFGYRMTNISGLYSTKKISGNLQYYQTLSANDFSYRNYYLPNAPEEKNSWAEYYNHGLQGDFSYLVSPKVVLSVHSWYHFSDRRLQPPVGVINIHEHQNDDNIRLAAEGSWKNKLGLFSLRSAWFRDVLNYTSDASFNNSVIQTTQAQIEQGVRLIKRIDLTAGANVQLFSADNDAYSSIEEEWRTSMYLLMHYKISPALKFTANFRHILVQGYQTRPAPMTGLEYVFLRKEFIKAGAKGNVSGSYRVPTMNERYWNPGGNLLLKPETGESYEGGLYYQYCKASTFLESEFTFFHMNVRDWVQWLPIQSVAIWSPVNINRVVNNGIEFSTKAGTTLGEWKIRPGFMYAYNKTVNKEVADPSDGSLDKQLIYVPLNKTSASLELSYKWFSLMAQYAYTGYRFTLTDNSTWLPAYSLLNAGLGVNVNVVKGTGVELWGKVNNLLNTEYQTIENRAMPGRYYQLSIRIYYKK